MCGSFLLIYFLKIEVLKFLISVDIMFEKILSIIVFELEVTLDGWIMYGRNIDEARESKNLLVGECC